MSERVSELVSVVLTEDELKVYGKELAETHIEIESDTESMKETAKQLKGEIAKKESRCRELQRAVSSGKEMRMVECMVEKDFARGVVLIVRPDTGEVVRERLMEPHERQREMFKVKAEDDA